MKLEGKVAIITGAGAGIGEATSKLFSKEGASVVCNDIEESGLQVVDEISYEGGKAIFIQRDISDMTHDQFVAGTSLSIDGCWTI